MGRGGADAERMVGGRVEGQLMAEVSSCSTVNMIKIMKLGQALSWSPSGLLMYD